jgi:hypothetical protein
MKTEAKKTIFDWLKEITYYKSPSSNFTTEDWDSFNSFMVHRYVSMLEEYTEVANFGQRIPYPEKEKTYKYYCSMLPKKNVFLKYVKSSRKKPSEKLLHHIANHYTISLGEAEDYIYILKKEGVEMILTKAGIEDKEIKKLLKEIQ